MDIRRVMCCFVTLALLVWCSGARAEDFSNAEQYGNKTANLAKLNQSCSRPIMIGAVEYTVKVPDFIGVSDEHVHDFLQEKISDFDARWDALCVPYREQQAEILANKKLPDDFLNAAEALGEQIKRVFMKEFKFREDQEEFITTANAKEYRLMVRSTGKEDTDKMANAGGNTTVINVEPTVDAIRSAIGEVVASYIGKKSLSQRVSVATDEENINDLFKRPFMPVLLQVMIGELRGGQPLTAFEDVATLPVPGVMFTTEAEGFTDGLVHIQTTFGHNEGVVNSLVPVDTWYVSEHNTVFPIVRHKHERLVPGAQGLERKKNTLPNGETFGFLPSLTGEQAQAIAQAGRVIEEYYEKHMDVEFVLMPQSKTIYLVQARPIVKGEKNPTYLTDSFIRGKEVMQCSKVGVGNAGVAIAASADGIMVYETLAQALNVYLQKKSDDRNAIKCVVVQQAPAATSHEATTFRSFNMPVMQHNNVGSVTEWLTSQKGKIVVDSQRGLLLATDNEIVFVNGWFESPLPRQLSVGVTAITIKPEWMEALTMRGGVVKVSPAELFEILKSPTSKKDARMALMELLKKMFVALKHIKGGAFFNHVSIDVLDLNVLMESKGDFANALMMSMLMAAQDYVKNLKNISDDVLARNMQLLYPVQFMQALYNQMRDPQIVAPISLATLLTGVKRDVRAVALSGASVQSVATLDMLKVASDYGFSPEIKHRWAEFTQGLSPFQQGILMRQMQLLEELGSMPMFVNVIFPSMYKQGDDAVGVVRQIVRLMEHNADSFKTLQEMQQKIAGWDVSVFADPAVFTKQWGRFNSELLSYFMSDDFANMFQSLEKNNLVQISALSVMHKMVDAFDASIKSLKGSAEYVDVQQKVDNVHTMVVAYWNLFERWVKFLPENIFPVSVEAEYWLRSDGRQDVEKYIEIVGWFKHVGFSMRGLRALEPSLGFNVTLAAIGSSGRIDEVRDSSYRQSWTLEDYFTLSHQNLLVVLNYLLKQSIDLSSLFLPQKVKDFMTIFETPFEYIPQAGELVLFFDGETEDKNPTYKASLVGMLLNADTVEFTYNIPLRGHSASFVLSYDYKKESLELLGNFYRNLERVTIFRHIAFYGDILDIYVGTRLLSSTVVSNATYLRWNVNDANVERLQNALTRILILMYPESMNIQLPSDHWKMIYELKDDLANQASRKIVLSALWYYSAEYQMSNTYSRLYGVLPFVPENMDELLQCYFDYLFQNIGRERLIIEGAAFVELMVNSKNSNKEDMGFRLLKKLLEQFGNKVSNEQRLVFTELIKAAKGATARDVDSGFKLFKELFKEALNQAEEVQKQIFIGAIIAAKIVTKRDANSGVELFKELFKEALNQTEEIQKQIFIEAIIIVTERNADSGFKLFREFLKEALNQAEEVQKQIFIRAIAAAKIVTEKKVDVGLRLFEDLVYQVQNQSDDVRGQVFKEALEVASKAFYSGDKYALKAGIHLFDTLLRYREIEVRRLVSEHIRQLLSDKSLKESVKTRLNRLYLY